MSEEGSITCWISKLRTGDALAASELWQRFYERLVRTARQKLRDASRRTADEEDVVIDAFDSFCRGVQLGRFPKLNDRDDLWQVLIMLTDRKAANQRNFHRRQKRGGGHVRGESAFFTPEGAANGIDQIVGAEPTPEFTGEVCEEVRRLLDLLDDPTLQTVAVAKLEGFQNAEIAERLQVQVRTVERKLRSIREIWSGEENRKI